MARFYFIRHAESQANARGIYQGQTYDTGLSLHGQKQAKKLAEYFNGITLDKIITSPFKRTMATARILAQALQTPILIEPQIIETNHGEWEGMDKKDIEKKWPEIYAGWNRYPAKAVFPGGESFRQTQKRILKWWRQVKGESGLWLVVTHDNVIRLIIADVLGLSLNNIWKFNLTPTGVTIIEDDRLIKLNDVSHLDKETMDISCHAL